MTIYRVYMSETARPTKYDQNPKAAELFTRFSDLNVAIKYINDTFEPDGVNRYRKFLRIEAEITRPLNEPELRQLERQVKP